MKRPIGKKFLVCRALEGIIKHPTLIIKLQLTRFVTDHMSIFNTLDKTGDLLNNLVARAQFRNRVAVEVGLIRPDAFLFCTVGSAGTLVKIP